MGRLFGVITNVSSEFGIDVCRNFSDSGHDLLITSKSDEVFKIQSFLEEEGHYVEAMRVDLGSYAGIENLYGYLSDSFDVDLLVMCTDSYGGEVFLETSLNDEIRQVNHNVIAPLHLVKKVLPDMRRRHKGKIIFADVNENKKKSIQGPVHKASRAFLEAFSKEVSLGLQNSGVTITINYDPKDHLLQRIHNYAYQVLPEFIQFKRLLIRGRDASDKSDQI